MARCRSKAFTLIELLIVVTILAMLVSILLPTLGRAVEFARRATCRTNMKEIVRACGMYANSDIEQRKMTITGTHGRASSALPSWGSASAGTWYTPQSGAVTVHSNRNCCWMLVRSRAASPATFICPSLVDGFKAADPNDNGFNAGGNKTFGYSFISMVDRTFSAQGKSVFAEQWTKNIDASMVLVGDLNPRFFNPDDLDSLNTSTVRPNRAKSSSDPAYCKANPNSPAHLSSNDVPDGQNVGTWDGSVRWVAANADTTVVPGVSTNVRSPDYIYQTDPNPAPDNTDSTGRANDIDDILLLN
jgi:prepilin-type N-terminal cleavage/methylation domain-containing protein